MGNVACFYRAIITFKRIPKHWASQTEVSAIDENTILNCNYYNPWSAVLSNKTDIPPPSLRSHCDRKCDDRLVFVFCFCLFLPCMLGPAHVETWSSLGEGAHSPQAKPNPGTLHRTRDQEHVLRRGRTRPSSKHLYSQENPLQNTLLIWLPKMIIMIRQRL